MPDPKRIDLRGMPMEPRHALLFGMLFGLEPGEQLEVTNDHDPSGLRVRLAAEEPVRYTWTWLEQGPVDWRFRVERLSLRAASKG